MKLSNFSLLTSYIYFICIILAHCLSDGVNFVLSLLVAIAGATITVAIILMIVSVVWCKNPLVIFKEIFKPSEED